LKSLALAVLLLAIAAHADEWKKDYSVTGTPEVKVDSNDGNIEVTTGSQSTVSARVITAGWRIGVGHVHIVDEQKGNHIELEVRTPHIVFFGISRHSIRVELTVPRSSNLDLHSGDGRITLDFPVTVSGRMSPSNIHGKLNGGGELLEVRTSDGIISLERE